ncbi:hypothetical protein BV20DRAFT_1000884 [Pilatotrama ljubarskyi]|nr:hypothetical protein BV20DRAFT_1000884 [Pilatotrama ljubarskyi]
MEVTTAARAERHPELYFTDGDVVLQARLLSANGEIQHQLFRVHKAILSFHSATFRNMFADASAVLGPTYDNHPVVDMPDNAEDLARLLDCVYHPSRYLGRGSQVQVTLELPRAVRLADKYLLDTVRADLVQRVADDWPSGLFEWEIREGEISSILTALQDWHLSPAMDPGFSKRKHAIAARLPEPASAIMFAQEFGCREVLPAAFYLLARINVTDDYDAGVRPCWSYEPRLSASWSRLDQRNLLRYIRGCEAMDQYYKSISDGFDDGMWMLSEDCLPWWAYAGDPGEVPINYDDKQYVCLQYIRKLRDIAWEPCSPREILRGFSALYKAEHSVELKRSCPSGLCEQCSSIFWRWVRDTQLSTWEQLPKFFQLD